MPRKSAKQIVDEVVAKVNAETAPKKETPKITVEHNRLCMTVVTGGGNCNCPASKLQ
jgi:hypothetical protein